MFISRLSNHTLTIVVLCGDAISDRLIDKLQKLQNRATPIITGADYLTSTTDLLSRLGWTNLKERRNQQKVLMMFNIFNGMTPAYLEEIFASNIGRSIYNLRTPRWNLALPAVKTNYYRNSFAYTGAKVWNALPDNLKGEKSTAVFKNKLESSISLSIALHCNQTFHFILFIDSS